MGRATANETPRVVGRPRKVSHDQIIAAALSVMEKHGFAALSMRSLARQLGINHATLYNYVSSIDEIEQDALDQLMARIPMPDKHRDTPIRHQLIDHLLGIHEIQTLFPSFCNAAPGTRTWRLHMRCMAAIMDAVTDSPDQIEDAAIAYNTLISLIATNAERIRISDDKTPIKPYLDAMAALSGDEYEPLFRPLVYQGGYSKKLSDFVYRLDYLIDRLLPHIPAIDDKVLAQVHQQFTEKTAAKNSAK